MIDLLEIEDFLDSQACAALRAELRAAAGGPATVLSADPAGMVRSAVRRVTRAAIPPATREHVTALLMARKPALEHHFGLALKECEEPQFLRYQPGDFFVAHQDGNTPLIHDQSRFRKVSAVIFLSAQSDQPLPESYGGGELVLHGPVFRPGAESAARAGARDAGVLPSGDHARGHAGHARRTVHDRVVVSLTPRLYLPRERGRMGGLRPRREHALHGDAELRASGTASCCCAAGRRRRASRPRVPSGSTAHRRAHVRIRTDCRVLRSCRRGTLSLPTVLRHQLSA